MLMKNLKSLLPVVIIALTAGFTSCGSDDDPSEQTPKVVNVNANDGKANVYTARMEFPNVSSPKVRVLVNSTSDYGVNYSVGWDDELKSQRYSCYAMYNGNSVVHTSRWYADASKGETQYPIDERIPSQYRISGDPFWGSGYDHGHICPSADRLCSREANIQTFYLSNMQPQVNKFNAGVWSNMEQRVRSWNTYSFRDTLYVCKGGTIAATAACPDAVAQVRGQGWIIPKYYFMAILCKNASGYKALGFWVEHKANEDGDLAKYVVNIDDLERRTGLDFFCNLPDDVENKIEALPVENVKTAWGF